MAGPTARLIVALALAIGAAGVQARERAPQTPWSSLTPEERRILEPVARDWDRLPGYQQKRLQGAARHYPSMRPIEKERFEQRIRDWAVMSPEERRRARETFKGMRRLPPAEQHELRERWLKRRGAEGREAPSSAWPGDRRPGEGREPSR